MKNPAVVIFSVGLTAIVSVAPVLAQGSAGAGSYVIDKTHLDRVKPYNAPRQFQVLDERPIVTNHLTPEQQPDRFVFNVSAPPSVPGRVFAVQIGDPSAGAGSGAMPFRTGNPNLNSTRDLAPASDMYHSNISKPLVSRNLPGGQSTGIHGPLNESGKPASASTRALSGQLNPGQNLARTYNDYRYHAGSGLSSEQTVVTTAVAAKLKSSESQDKLKGLLKTRLLSR